MTSAERITQLEGKIVELETTLAELRKRLESHRVAMLDLAEADTSQPSKPAATAKRGPKANKTTSLVRAAIGAQGDKRFTVFDLDAWLKGQRHDIPRNKVSFILASLIRRGEIRVIEKGAGRKPSTLETIRLK